MAARRRSWASALLRATEPGRTGVGWWDASEIALVALGFLAYFLVRGGVVDRTGEALRNAHRIIDLQHSLGLFVEPAVQRWVVGSEVLWRTMNFVYFWGDFPLIVGVGLVLFVVKRHQYTLLRDSLLLSGGLALVVYWSFPVAPPRFLTEYGFVDTLELYSNLSYQAQSMQPFVNPFAAVPSLHVGWAMLLAVAVFGATRSWLARGGVLLVGGLQAVAVVGTGNHFLFDGVAGLLVCALGLAMAVLLQRSGYPAVRRWLAVQARPPAPSAEAGGGPRPRRPKTEREPAA